MPLPWCPSCRRHIKACEPACPFCGNPLACRERNATYVLASGLAALALAACQPPVAVAPLASPSPIASDVPSPMPSPSASASSPSPTPLMSAIPSASAPAPAYGKATILSGTVYDESGVPVDEALVRVTSLDASVPYTASTTTSQGSYVINNLPEGANVEVIALKEGWTSRRRVGSFQSQARVKNEVDFGGQTDPAFFISDFPEVAAVDPGFDATTVDPGAVSYKLTLSEPLDATNRDRFANAVRLFPANRYAAPEGDGTGFTDPTWDYGIKNGTTFLDDAKTRASVTWDAGGTIATLSFAAPLIADHINPARYQVALVAGERIVDAHDHQLGMDGGGSHVSYPSAGNLIHATVKAPVLGTGASPWSATHQDAAPFAVKVEAAPLELLSAAYTANVGASSRFELTFSKPLAAYNGRPGGHVGDAIRTASVLDMLSMAVSDRAGGTAGVDLKGGQVTVALDPNAGPFASPLEQEFKLRGGSSAAEPYGEDLRVAESDPAKAGRYLLAVNPGDPRTLYIYIVGRTNIFDQRIVELKVRVAGMSDRAGNVLDPDRQQVTTAGL